MPRQALFVPYLAEVIKRFCFKPKLKMIFKLTPPFCHKTEIRSQPRAQHKVCEPVFYFRFKIINEGKSRAYNCEVILENLWIYDSSKLGKPKLYPNFSPLNLAWSGNHSKDVRNINPGREIFCDIGHIASKAYQISSEKNKYIDVPSHYEEALRFMLELPKFFFSQPNCLIPGKYIIQIGLYSENTDNQKLFLDISWSGKWKDSEENMFREIVIKRTEKPKQT